MHMNFVSTACEQELNSIGAFVGPWGYYELDIEFEYYVTFSVYYDGIWRVECEGIWADGKSPLEAYRKFLKVFKEAKFETAKRVQRDISIIESEIKRLEKPDETFEKVYDGESIVDIEWSRE